MRKLIIAVIFFLLPFKNVFATENSIKLFVDKDEVVNLPVAPTIIDDSVVVPVREVLEKFDAVLDWKQDSRELFITKGDTIILLQADKKIANVNGCELSLSTPATIINDKLMIPVRFIAETFGFEIGWDERDRKVIINSKMNDKSQNEATKIIFVDENDEYSYSIKANAKIDSVKEYYLEGNRLAIDINNSQMALQKNEITVESQLVSKIRIVQNQVTPVKITRVVFDLMQDTDYQVKLSGDGCSVNVTFGKTISSCKNISYDENIIILKKENSVPDLSQIVQTDNYCNKKYVLKFPMQIENLYGNGKFFIRNDYFSFVYVKSDSIIINENKIWAYDISQDNQNIYLKAISPKEKYQNIFVIDAGHGGTAYGAVNNNVKEKDLTFDIVKKVLDMFEGDKNVKVYSTRLSDVKITLDERSQMANDIGDLFVSVHINASDKNKAANGTEVFYCPHENDSQKKFSSKILTETLHKNLLKELNSFDRKIKIESYAVLKKTTVPAALCEIGFISNPNEFENLCNENYRFKAAKAIYDSVNNLLCD